MHREQLKKFSELIRPIATALVSASDAAIDKDKLQALGSGPTSQTETSVGDSSGFFHVAPSNISSQTKPLFGSPPHTAPLQPVARQANNQLSSLKQIMLESRAALFGLLLPHQQALARVGGMLNLHREDYGQRVYHFMHSNVLVAVLDRPQNCFYMRKALAAGDYSDIHTVVRPDAGGASSGLFEKVPVLDAVWAYALHDPEALLDLPAELATSWLRLRALPTVSPRMLGPQHMAVISRLLMRDQHIDDLLQGQDVQAQSDLVTSLACLLITRSVLLTQTPLQSMRYASPSVQKKQVLS
jgi:hypothetical protein